MRTVLLTLCVVTVVASAQKSPGFDPAAILVDRGAPEDYDSFAVEGSECNWMVPGTFEDD